MRAMIAAAALLSLAAPVAAAPAAKGAGAASKAQSVTAKIPDFDIGQVMAVFDKIFPPQPDPPAARLTLARTSVRGLFPDGTYAKMMDGLMRGTIDRVMSLSAADLGGGVGADKGKPADTTTLREKMAKNDPAFDERMRITEQVMTDEMAKVARLVEPGIREGLARSMARRFDEKQLADINAFLATDSGKAFGSQSMAMWVDPEMMRAIIGALPQIMAEMPAAMKRVETETARLPKPKSDTKAKS